MKNILGDLDFVALYIDDICVASASEAQHRQHLKIVFDRLQQANLHINPTHPLLSCSLASHYAVGAALHQVNDKQLQHLSFYYNRITETQKRYRSRESIATASETVVVYRRILHENRAYYCCVQYSGRRPIPHCWNRTNRRRAAAAVKRHRDWQIFVAIA
ncbi:uncharacterized protein LOC122756524 [Drosophila santomea]|uniref:uncharacterized protein LOC122756524 n=1 Tax=Drosophila santomea TaxID=129105 RepID=UPI001CCB5C93|nr:uncharacterized protein LOC122756524 [Drosophila santomea]